MDLYNILGIIITLVSFSTKFVNASESNQSEQIEAWKIAFPIIWILVIIAVIIFAVYLIKKKPKLVFGKEYVFDIEAPIEKSQLYQTEAPIERQKYKIDQIIAKPRHISPDEEERQLISPNTQLSPASSQSDHRRNQLKPNEDFRNKSGQQSYEDNKRPLNETLTGSELSINRHPIGILNKGETCYLNAIIQAISSSKKLIKELETIQQRTPNDNLKRFIDVLRQTRSPEAKPKYIVEKLSILVKNCGWIKKSQQDAFDLLSKLISSIEAELAAHKGINSIEFTLPPKFKLRHTSKTGFVDNCQKYLGLSLSLVGNFREKPGVHISKLVKEYFKPVFIDDNPNQESWCEFDEKVPNVILFHIQANEYDHKADKMIKPEYYIQFDETLKIRLRTSKGRDNCNFNLTGCVYHKGNVGGGHYVAYRKFGGVWYQMNDNLVNKTDFNEIPKNPYIFVYERE